MITRRQFLAGAAATGFVGGFAAGIHLGKTRKEHMSNVSSIEKRTVVFPFQRNGFHACAVPGPAAFGSGIRISAATRKNPADSTASTFEDASQQLVIPSGRVLRGVGIDPYSPLDTCDIWVGGNQGDNKRFRLSPGNPMLGEFPSDEQFVVSLPFSLPNVEVDSPGGVAVWDGANYTIGSQPNAAWVGLPLRLELYYGDIVPLRAPYRAPLSAFSKFDIAASGVVDWYVCTQGRRRVTVDVIAQTSTLVCDIKGVAMQKSETATTNDIAFFSTSIAGTGATTGIVNRFDVVNTSALNPWDFIRIRMSETVGGGTTVPHNVWVHGYDW